MSDGDFQNPYNNYAELPEQLKFYHCIDPYDENSYCMMSFWSNGNVFLQYPDAIDNKMNGRYQKFFSDGSQAFISLLSDSVAEGESVDFEYEYEPS